MKKSVNKGSQGKINLFFLNEVLKMPSPEWLIENFLTQKSIVLLYGCPGVGKSFIAIDIAIAVAKGFEWFGNKASTGTVVLISTEGNQGLQLRLKGWEIEHGIQLANTNNLLFCFEPVDFANDKALATFLKEVEALSEKPKLIVIDTFADCFAGNDANENDSGSVGRFLAGVKYAIEKTGATALIIHHTKKGDRAERGSTVLRAVMDSMYLVRKTKSELFVITSTKQRNFATSGNLYYLLKEVQLPKQKNTFSLSTTCVPQQIDMSGSAAIQQGAAGCPKNQQVILELLAKNECLKQSEIRKASGMSKSSLSESLKKLTTSGLIGKTGDYYSLTPDVSKCLRVSGSGGSKGIPPEPNTDNAENEDSSTCDQEDIEDDETGVYSEEDYAYDDVDDWDYDPNDFEEPTEDEDPF